MDERELRALLEEHHPASWGWARFCARHDGVEAQDVLQTAYLKVLDGRARFEGRSAFRTWLFAVIRRTAADERRRGWFRRLGLGGDGRERDRGAAPAGQEALLERSETAQAFREALAGLPRRQQEILHLTFYQDLSLQEAAAVAGVSLGSARTHYDRGKKSLRRRLGETEGGNATGR